MVSNFAQFGSIDRAFFVMDETGWRFCEIANRFDGGGTMDVCRINFGIVLQLLFREIVD